jgi:signal transduction histidine kinase
VRFRLSVQNNHATVAISNAGAPIPERERERIFERFYRLDPSRSGRVPGTGLGLSLAREIVRSHGGDIRLDVSKDDVNTFIVALPLD